RVLAKAGAAVAAGCVHADRSDAGILGDLSSGRGGGAARQLGCRPLLRQQLVPDLPLAVLLRKPGAAVAASAPLVALRRGAVLPRLAGAVLAGAGADQAPLRLHACPRRGHRIE